jgi:hypothetical protein
MMFNGENDAISHGDDRDGRLDTNLSRVLAAMTLNPQGQRRDGGPA